MSAFECMKMRALTLRAMAGQASEAERLELESHLDGCNGCREHHAALAPVRALQSWEPPSLSAKARERVRREALAAVGEARAPRPVAASRIWVLGLAMGAAALAAFLALRPPPCRIVGGDAALLNGVGTRIDDGAQLGAPQGGQLLLDGVQVAMQGKVSWGAPDRVLYLQKGRVRVEVDPRRHQKFSVKTPRFQVEVLGTVFDVDLEGVRTERGRVKVILDGKVVAEVAAGESWHLPAPVAVVAPPVAPPVAVVAPPVAPAPVAAPVVEPRHHQDDVAAKLVRARRALGQGDGAAARSILGSVQKGPRALLAEARLLEAESFLVERRYDRAISGYQALVHRFGDTNQGESALYAIAQLQVDSGRSDAAERALHRYLDRYPRGRFSEEARSRLAALLGR